MTLPGCARRAASSCGRASFLLALILGIAASSLKAQTIQNGSFETNVFANGSGFVSQNTNVIGWTASPGTDVGLKPNGVNEFLFADNGAVPHGTRVAFLRSNAGATTSLSTSITGLVVGKTYRVQFRANRRHVTEAPFAVYRLNNGQPVNFGVSVPVGGANPYSTVTAFFTATATTAPLVVSNTTADESSLLVDNFTVALATAIQVTNANNSGVGSLRAAVATAQGTPVPNVITFAPALNGTTIYLDSEIAVNDPSGLSIDATSLAGGLTIVPWTLDTRAFSNAVGSALALRKITLSLADLDGSAGVVQNDGSFDAVQCRFTENYATGLGSVLVNSGQMSLTDCAFVDNESDVGAGTVATNGTALTLNRCTFSDNFTAGVGAAVYGADGLVTINACTFADNTAEAEGGAILFEPPVIAKLTHCTFSGNTGSMGGAIHNRGLLTMTNSIVHGNDAIDDDTVDDVDNSGDDARFVRVGKNFIGAFANSSGLADDDGPAADPADPQLDAFDSHGGPTQTYSILFASPARNAAVASSATNDQRGRPIINGADVGAYETQRGTFQFASTLFKAKEGETMFVAVSRLDGSEGAVSVRVFTTPGTATAPADFAPIANSADFNITFNPGEDFKVVPVNTVGDSLIEGNHSFTATLTMPVSTAGAALGTPTVATATIIDPIQVTNTNDDGPGSLRQAVVTAATNGVPDIIQFAAALNGKTITLGSDIVVDDTLPVLIDAGPLAAGIRIAAGPSGMRSLTVEGTSDLTFRRVKFSGGRGSGGNGGAFSVASGAKLTMEDCEVFAAFSTGTPGFGGGVYNEGEVTLVRCTFFSNGAKERGGAIYNAPLGELSMTQCTLFGNSGGFFGGPPGYGGALYIAPTATATLTHCTIYNNPAVTAGGGVMNEGTITVTRCIVSNNTANQNSSMRDMRNLGQVFLEGKNFVTFYSEGGTTTPLFGASNDTSDPQIGGTGASLSDGFTSTIPIDSDSPARNAGVGSTITSDQRGFPIVGVPDVGAYEVQNGGVFTLNTSTYTAAEGLSINLSVRRGSGAGKATVRVITTPGTATSPADFAARPNTDASMVEFLDGETVKPISIPTVPDAGSTEPNEVFTISLTNPSAGAKLGTTSSASATITDTSSPGADGSLPTATVTSPAANGIVNAGVGTSVTITGTATDNRSIASVTVSGGASPGTATRLASAAASTGWTYNFVPVAGLNTITVGVQDQQGNSNPAAATRTFMVHRPFSVSITGNGSVSSGFYPSSYREVGKSFTIVATPGAGAMFAGWTILSTHTFADLAVPESAKDKLALTGIFREGLILRATFVPSPYPALAAKGGTEYLGLIHADPDFPDRPDPEIDGTDATIATEGHLKITLMSTGAFSGVIKMDGGTLTNLAGTFDHEGNARFGTARATTLSIARPGKPSYVISLSIDLDPGRFSDSIYGEIVIPSFRQSVVTGQSYVFADRAYYDGLTPATTVHASYLGANNATQTYTVILPPADNSFLGLAPEDYPQGFGYAFLTVSKAGLVTITGGKLADGTPFTGSTRLANDGIGDFCPLFVQLYTGLRGFISGDIFLDSNDSISDMFAGLWWVRPVDVKQHYYPNGWQEPIDLGLLGARYTPTFSPPSSVLRSPDSLDFDHVGDPLPLVDPVTGNALLSFFDGQLIDFIDKPVNVSTTNVVTKVVTNDPTFSLTLVPKTGALNGKFVHENDAGVLTPKMTGFQGIIYQKCLVSGGYGYFLTRPTVPIDFSGQSGAVTLIGNDP